VKCVEVDHQGAEVEHISCMPNSWFEIFYRTRGLIEVMKCGSGSRANFGNITKTSILEPNHIPRDAMISSSITTQEILSDTVTHKCRTDWTLSFWWPIFFRGVEVFTYIILLLGETAKVISLQRWNASSFLLITLNIFMQSLVFFLH